MRTDADQETKTSPPAPNMNGAAIVDENGNEIPITPEMIEDFLSTLSLLEEQLEEKLGN